MDLLGMLVLVAAVAAIIIVPIVRRRDGALEERPAPPDAEAQKRLALTAIRELEFDHATGKIDDEDYRVLRSRYDARAVEVLERGGARPPVEAAEDGAAQLEAEIRAARGRRFCAECGGPMPKAARFCPACGTLVEVPA